MGNHLWYYREKLHITAQNVLLMLILLVRSALALDLALAIELTFALAIALSPALVFELAVESQMHFLWNLNFYLHLEFHNLNKT